MAIIRRNHGRGHSYSIDGMPTPGVTTIINGALPKPALIDWAARTTADYAVNHWDDLAALPYADRLRILERARWESSQAAMAKGTAVHALGERVAQGESVDVPEDLIGHVESYVDFLNTWQVEPVLLEAVIGNRAIGYCGTLDLVADLRSDAGVTRWLLDLKTGKAIYGDNALQLCGYQRAEVFIDSDGSEQPMTNLGIERVGIVHVRADGWDLLPVEVDDDVWSTFRHLAWLYRHTDAMRDWIGQAEARPGDAA